MATVNFFRYRHLFFACYFFLLGIFLPTSSWAKKLPDDLTELSLENLLDIKVSTVSRQKSTLGKSPAAAFVISSEMIRRSGATVIPELFRMVPGMDVARVDNNKWNISVRGFNGDRFQGKLLVQIDGRPLYTPLFSGVYWDMVDYPLEDIDRIEVIRGPGASVWGANAVNGIINIITKAATKTTGGLLSGGGGTVEQGFGTVRYGGKINDRVAYRTYAKGFNRAKQFAPAGDSSDAWWGGNGGVRFDWQPTKKDALIFEGSYLRSNAGRKDVRAQVAAPLSFVNIEDEIGDNGSISANWTREFRKGSNLETQFYLDHFNRFLNNLGSSFCSNTVSLDLQHQISAGERLNFVYGAGYRLVAAYLEDSQIDNGFALNFNHTKRNTHLFSGFLQSQIALVKDRLEITLGSKLERNTFSGFEIQPTGRLLWTPTEQQSAWLAVSRAVRTPNFIENELANMQPGSSPAGVDTFPRIIRNSHFRPEKIVAFEGGYRAQVHEKFSADLALFYNLYSDLKTLVPGAVAVDPTTGVLIQPLQPRNLMKGHTYGAELALNGQPTGWWHLSGAYTFLKMSFDPDSSLPASTQLSLNASEGQSPKHQLHLQSSFKLPHRVELDLIGRFVASLSGFNPNGVLGFSDGIDHYVSLDTRLAWRPPVKNMSLEIVGQNLLANHHAETGASPTVRNPSVEISRSVYGKLTWRF